MISQEEFNNLEKGDILLYELPLSKFKAMYVFDRFHNVNYSSLCSCVYVDRPYSYCDVSIANPVFPL